MLDRGRGHRVGEGHPNVVSVTQQSTGIRKGNILGIANGQESPRREDLDGEEKGGNGRSDVHD